MTTLAKMAIALALTITTATGVLAASKKHPRVHYPPVTMAPVASGFVPGPVISPEEEAILDPAKGYVQGY